MIPFLYNNSINVGEVPILPPSDNTALIKQTADLIRQWESDPDGPNKFVYLLDDRCADFDLSISNLKGHDHQVARLLKQMQEYIGTIVFLARLEWGYTVESPHCMMDEDMDTVIESEKKKMTSVLNIESNKFEPGTGVFLKEEVLNINVFRELKEERLDVGLYKRGETFNHFFKATALVFCPKKNWSILRWDVIGIELSIAEIETMESTEDTHDQARGLLKSAMLMQTCQYDDDDDDSLDFEVLLMMFLKSIRRLHFVDVYLGILKQNVIWIKPKTEFSSEITQGCSELGWVELESAIRQYVDKYVGHCDFKGYFRSLAFSPIPSNDQQRQYRSEVLDYIVKKITSVFDPLDGIPGFFDIFCHLGHYSVIREIVSQQSEEEYLDNRIPPLIKNIYENMSPDKIETFLQPYLSKLIKHAISQLRENIKSAGCDWYRKVYFYCTCRDCIAVSNFLNKSDVQKEEFMLLGCKRWQHNYPSVYPPSYKDLILEGDSTGKVIITKKPTESQKTLEFINYLESL